MVFDGKNLGFMEKVTLGGHFAGASTDSETFVLEDLEFIDIGGFNVGEPGRTGIGDNGFD